MRYLRSDGAIGVCVCLLGFAILAFLFWRYTP
jgi:hypothetical protein